MLNSILLQRRTANLFWIYLILFLPFYGSWALWIFFWPASSTLGGRLVQLIQCTWIVNVDPYLNNYCPSGTKKIGKVLNAHWFTAFFVRKFWKSFIFLNLTPLCQILEYWYWALFANVPIFIVLIIQWKSGIIGSAEVIIFGVTDFLGAKLEAPPKKNFKILG